MRLTVLNQTAKGLPEKISDGTDEYELRPGVLKDLERVKWYLWHGNVFQALKELEGLELDLESASFESKDQTTRKVLKGVEELHTYVRQNRQFIPNYGERYRNGELISSGLRGVDSQSGGKQAHGEEATDAMDAARSPSTVADPDTRSE
jgi:hypothetical protein